MLRTAHWDDWSLDDLLAAKGDTRVSLVVPARNEAATVGGKIVGADRRQPAAVPAERGPHPGHQKSLCVTRSCRYRHDAPMIASRSRNFWILPVTVIGKLSVMCT